MTKNQFLSRVVYSIPKIASVWIITQHPIYSWQSTWNVILHCEKACFKSNLVRGGKTSTIILCGARGKASAEAKAIKYHKWFMEARANARVVEQVHQEWRGSDD